MDCKAGGARVTDNPDMQGIRSFLCNPGTHEIRYRSAEDRTRFAKVREIGEDLGLQCLLDPDCPAPADTAAAGNRFHE
jgi:hypothetical protein